jgi:tetratricopeptide (TPR) repeat protein
MNRENILFSLVGIGFGLFFGFGFASWANMRAGATLVGDGRTNQAQLPMNGVAERQRLETAAEAAVKAARENPSDYEAQMQAARASFQTERLDDVLEFLLRANTLKPEELEPVVALGNVNYDTGNYQAAEKWYTAALVKNPKDINVRTDLGLTFLFRQQQNVDRAIQEFRRSLSINPRHEQTLQNMVVALVKKGSFQEAEVTLGKLREVNPNNPSLTKLSTDLEAARSSSKQPASKGK